MIHLQKYSRNAHKNLVSKKEENTLRMKVLRYVMAVGFVLSPWLGGEAYADPGNITFVNDKSTNLMQNGKAHIYAQNVDTNSSVGLNRFQDFKVVPKEIANLYFQDTKGTQVDTLVNTVVNRIDISGTVNGIRNNTIGGNLYFISPAGMVVGAGGVINAGALTVITTGIDDITDPATAISKINYVYRPLGNSPINIQGKIYTVNGIDLQSLSIEISKNANGDIPCLKTGMVFNSVVNTDGLVDNVSLQYESSASGNGDLQLKRSDSTDTKINLLAYKLADDDGDLVKLFGSINLSGCDVDALGDISITSGNSVNITNNTNINTNNAISINLENNTNSQYVGDFVFESGRIEAGGMPYITVGNDINIGNGATFVSTLVTTDTINFKTQKGSISNYGNIRTQSTLNMQAGQGASGGTPCLINGGTIESQGGGLSLTAKNNITNNGTIEANAQIKFAVGGNLTNRGTIESTSSNVQAHIGRNFKNIAVYNNESTENRTLIGGIIEAGGNVQVDYNLDNEGIGVASSEERIDGISNSGLIWAKGENGKDPVYDDKGDIVDSGSGNIWLTSSYNIENTATGQMIAGRQITLNARDFLHNYGLIEGVTYLDIKSIMGYVYNHDDGVIRSTGGNIDLSSGQENLKIDNDTDGQKKEDYRKFTPIIIEGLVEATSDDDRNNQTREGNIKITAHLGDIYINGGTIETIPETSENGEVKEVAGNVILDAAQNITIGFNITPDRADDPTTDNKYGDHPEYESKTEREYYKPILDSNLVPSSPCDEPATISGTNITLKSGSDEKYYILISNTTTGSNALPASNTLTASNAITINTDSMNIIGGTFNAGALEAVLAENGALSITGGTINAANVNSNTDMIINGGVINTGTAQGRLSANNISMESGSITGKDTTIAADKQVQLNGGSITTQAEGAGELTVTAGTNLVHNGATIAADNAAFSAGNSINLQSGSLTATGAAAFDVTSGTAGANSIVESASDYSLSAGSLGLSANQGNIILNGTNNVLQGVTLANVGGNIEIVNGNETNKKALTIATANGTTVGGTINVTNNGEGITVEGINAANNVSLAADKGIAVTGSLTTTGNVGLDADEGITVDGKVSAVNATLKAAKSIEVAGSVEATNNASLTAGEGIAVNNVSAQEKASFSAGLDFSHSNGVIKTKEVEVIAGQDLKLNSGSMEASTSASLTAGSAASVVEGHGYILEGTEYALLAPKVTASAVDAITMDSSANQLVNVNVTKVGGALALGSGNKNSTKALQVNLAQGKTVDGSLTIKNYKLDGDNSANDIVLTGALSANSINITNAEANINAGTGAVINATNISMEANSGAVNVDGNATITATNNGTFAANAQDINIAGGQITAGTVKITSNGTAANSGFTMNGGTITADTANLTAANAINQTAGSIVATTTVATAGTDLSLASNANKLQNVTVKANGSASIVSGNAAGVDLKVQTDGTVGGSLSIDSTSDIVSEGTISAAGDVTMTTGKAVTINSGTITANKFTANATDLFVNGGTIKVGTLAASKGLNIASNTQNTTVTNVTANSITAGGSIGMTGGNVATTSVTAGEALNITGGTVSSNGAISLSGATGVTIGIQAAITAGTDLTISSSGGSVTNNRALTATSGSVTLTGQTDVTNSADITAAQSVTMTATTGILSNSSVVKASGGNINLIGGTNINLQDGYGLEASDTINLNTDNMQITGGTIKANTLAASGSLDITGGSVGSTGALTISGAKGVTIGSAAAITTGNNLTIASSGGAVENNRILNITTGSVTLDGNGGVTNNVNITAAQDIILQSTTGAITNSGILSGGQDVAFSSTSGNIDNQGKITAGRDLSLNSTSGAIENSAAIEATNGIVELSGSGITNNSAINAAGSVVLIGTNSIANNAGITAGQGIEMTSTAGTISNGGGLTAKGGSVDLRGNKDITNDGRIQANRNVSIISGDGKVTNNAKLAAGVDFVATVQAVALFSVRALAEDSGSVIISGKGDVVNTENGTISATQNVSMSSTTGDISNSSTINAGQDVSITSTSGAITNSSEIKANTGSVEISGNGGVTNTADITAGSDVSMNATTGNVETSGTIDAGNDVSVTSSAGNIKSSSAITASNGSVTMTGQTGVANDNANASISAAGSVSMTSNAGAITNTSEVKSTSGSVEISGNGNVNNSANITANDNVTMSSGAGSVTNSSDVKAGTGSVEISGSSGISNTADITANQNLNLSANAGAISNAGNVTAETGNIGLNSNNGITSTAEGSSLNVNSLNGSISAATTYGEVNISEIIAGGNATASSQNGSVSIGTVAGNDVVLTGGSNVTIGSVTGSDVAITGGSNSDVNVDNITVDNSLKLQGDNITATNVNRSENASGALNVDVSGAGGTSSTAQGDVNLKIDGDVVFNNLNVTDAKIETSGTLDASKMHVEGKAQITSSNTTVNIYGKDVTPDPNDRNVIQDNGGGVSLTIDSNGVKSDDLGMDYPVQLSGKLVDYDPYDTYLEHYGDVADIFGRTDLIIAAEGPSGDFAQGGVVILKQDAEGLRIEEEKKEE